MSAAPIRIQSRALSLRARLTIVILGPLLLIAALIGVWAYSDAQVRAAERFDLSLSSTALSISRDIAVTGGDALSETTRDLLRDTSGGAVFYHVYAPDGVFVTGYATPPVPPNFTNTGANDSAIQGANQTYYDAIYQGQTVRALRFTQTMSMDQVSGPFTFTVWQNTTLRDGFVRGRTYPTFLIIALLMGALGVVVWFGVRFGLTPLSDLENAIAQRSPDDLSTIKRQIPAEVGGIVGTLNTLLGALDDTITAKDRFISDAAHQLRNPIAGVLSLAEAVQNAKSSADVKTRSADLVDAARQSSMLANNLLVLERARATPRTEDRSQIALHSMLTDIADGFGARARLEDIKFTSTIAPDLPALSGDAVMLEQSVLNILNNALIHGGPTLTSIELSAETAAQDVIITVRDDGKGIAATDWRTAMARFGQVEPSIGSGLGLPIALAVADALGGQITRAETGGYFSVSMVLPRS